MTEPYRIGYYMEDYYQASLERILDWQKQGAPIETAVLVELKTMALEARKQLVDYILNGIKYGTEGWDEWDILNEIMATLNEVQENG